MPTNHGSQSTGDHPPPAGDFVDHPNPGAESAALGYETTDVNAGGIMVFLGGLFGFVIIFFFFCFLMGRLINVGLEKDDGPVDKFHAQNQIFAGALTNGGKRENLKSGAAMEQNQLGMMTQQFPSPRLDVDDGNQATADLHAREDLLLEHYSSDAGSARRPDSDRTRDGADCGEGSCQFRPRLKQVSGLAEDRAPVVPDR